MKNRVFSMAVIAVGVSLCMPLFAGTSGCHRATTSPVEGSHAEPSRTPGSANGGVVSGDVTARDAAIAKAIADVLATQREAWNRGDIDAFMDAYVREDALVFTSGGKVRRGWDETISRYRARYVDAAAMGKLTFDGLETTVLSDDAALVLGRWRLVDTPESGHGVFTLLFVQRAGRWLIMHDHTSAEPDA